MLGSELRRLYLEFFESKGSKRIPSDSLVPNDPSLMFTSAGMVQFKPYFMGVQTPPASRATTAQKCLRTTDIEEVGDTSHCTFFEMLGNFSFGDYFKADAIAYAWEFLFDVLHLDLDRVRVSIFETDEEAYELWIKAGMPARKIFRFGEEDNYWAAGPTGPCGPDTEIFYDTQPNLPPTPDGVWDDKRWLEIWNLVFMQYDRQEDGTLVPLPRKNIDTGMGLERTAAVIANLRGPFETDLFAPILRRLEELSGLTYTSSDDDPKDVAFRRIADHARASAFCLADGVRPSNKERGYVLRRIMRGAIQAGVNSLGLQRPFLNDVVSVVIDHRQDDYPELAANREVILSNANKEELRFRETLASGTARLQAILADTGTRTVSGDDAFLLFTTYGFPVEMTQTLAAEQGASVDMVRYRERWDQHVKLSGGKAREGFVESIVPELRDLAVLQTLFVGYSEARSAANVLAIVRNGHLSECLEEGQEGQIVLDQTPFYAEAGGQVGDTGRFAAEGGGFAVSDTQKEGGYWFHHGRVAAGEIRVGDAVTAAIDEQRRLAIQRNHTTTHLLHKALQTVLGTHVHQRGSLVSPDRLRFDFSHEQGVTPAELRQVEGIVNEKILDDLPVHTFEKPIEEARSMGAMMLFGEKYGDVVRVVQAGDFSMEFCGGTHLSHTSQAGLFKIAGESSIQAGVRRIEALTGKAALMRTLDQERLLSDAAALLKTSVINIPASIERIQQDAKETERALAQLQKAAAGGVVDRLVAQARSVDGVQLVRSALEPGADAGALRGIADELLNKLKSGVVILGAPGHGKVALTVKVSADLVQRGVHAGDLVREAARITGGGGGGRPDFAQAGGKDPEKLEAALAAAEELLGGQLGR